jgi:hypothetical protein
MLEVIVPLREPVLAWCKEYRPRLHDVVETQYQRLDQRTEE